MKFSQSKRAASLPATKVSRWWTFTRRFEWGSSWRRRAKAEDSITGDSGGLQRRKIGSGTRSGEVSPTTCITANYGPPCSDLRELKRWELAHPGMRVDSGDHGTDGEQSGMSAQEYHTFMWSNPSYGVVLRKEGSTESISTVNRTVESGEGSQGEEGADALDPDARVDSAIQQPHGCMHADSSEQEPGGEEENLPLPPLYDMVAFGSPRTVRGNSRASTGSASSVETFISHVRQSFAYRGSRSFQERRPRYAIFKDEAERGWALCDEDVLDSSVKVS